MMLQINEERFLRNLEELAQIGRSHCPDEDTEPADLIAGANSLLQTALLLAHNSCYSA